VAVVVVVVVVTVAETVAQTIAGGVTPLVAGVVTTTPMVVATSNSTNKTNMRCWFRALARGPWLRGVRSLLPGMMAVLAVVEVLAVLAALELP